MKSEAYKKLYRFVTDKSLTGPLKALSYAITIAVFAFYPLALLLLYFNGYTQLPRIIITPAAAFIVLTAARAIINAPRPFQAMETPLRKAKGGKSFPSRHTFSAFMISFCMLGISTPAFLLLFGLSFILGALRVLCGLHYIKDVLAGLIFALAAYFLGLLIF